MQAAAVAAKEKKATDRKFFEQKRAEAAAVLAAAEAGPEEASVPAECSVTVEGGLVVAVIELPGVTSMAAVELDMTPVEISVSATPQDGGDVISIKLELPERVDVGGVRAKFSKKKQALTIKASVE